MAKEARAAESPAKDLIRRTCGRASSAESHEETEVGRDEAEERRETTTLEQRGKDKTQDTVTPFLCPNDNLSFGFTTPVRATIERTINGKTHLTVDIILKLSLIYHSGICDHSKQAFRMIANANIDKLMITFYHCPYTRTNTCTGQKFEYTTPDASR